MTEMSWGDRVGRVRVPLGNAWWIQQNVADLAPDEVAARATLPEFLEAMRHVQGAQIVEPAR